MIIFEDATWKQRRMWLLTFLALALSIAFGWWFAETAFAMQDVGGDGPITFPQVFDTDLLMWSALVSQFLPPVIGLITKTTWSDGAKMAVALLVCLVASVVTSYLLGKLDAANLVTSLLIVFTLTSIMYKQVWKGTKPMEQLQAI